MIAPRPYVTIGSHHRGPHVDALYALAGRCGGDVLIVDAHQPDVMASSAVPRLVRRIPYAGLDRRENAQLRRGRPGPERKGNGRAGGATR